MNPDQQMDKCIALCAQLKRQIKEDCYVSTQELGGKTLYEYESVRKTQLKIIEETYLRLLTLGPPMGVV